ncbi:MAG TPA: zinc ribbon domain-containing protein [Candidatus Lokiarchaeia archaeon]|nr:zinc ribbon domain-containing protein [Candidatus Lokiarchaeia archaeon]
MSTIDCPSCGRSNTTQARFCISCGKPLPKTDTVICPKCKQPNKSYNLFCIHCGAKISQQPQEWKEEDLRVTPGRAAEPQWKDENVVFCPNCNYGCQKEWATCPMCKTPLGTGATPTVPMFIEEPEPQETPAAAPSRVQTVPKGEPDQALKASVKRELDNVVKALSVISMSDLAQKVGISDEETVKDIVKDLIVSDEIEGHIDSYTNEFISEIEPATQQQMYKEEGATEEESDVQIISEPPAAEPADLAAVIKQERGMDVDEFVKELVNSLEIKRGFDFEGGRVHFKVVVKNNSKLVIHEIKIYLDVPDFFKVDEEEQSKNVPVLNPGESRGLDFYLDPKKCGTTDLSATVLFKDIYGKRHAKLVPSVEIQVKSPIIAPSKSSIEYIKEQTDKMSSDAKMFAIKDLDPELLYNAAFRAISKYDMSCVHDEHGEESLEAWFSAVSKSDSEPIVARIVMSTTTEHVLEIRVWCNDDKQLTGFLAKIITNLRDEIELIRRIKTEDKDQALKLMALGRNLEVVKNYAGLNWQAGDILNVLRDVKSILENSLEGKEINSIIVEIDVWLQRLDEMKAEDHIEEEFGSKLYNDVEHWQEVINHSIHR